MQESLRDLFVDYHSMGRFALGLLLLTLGETLMDSIFVESTIAWSLGAYLTHFSGMLAWNLVLILLFFHLPLYRELAHRLWLHATQQALSHRMRHVTTLDSLGAITLQFLTERLDILNGVLYLADENRRLQWLAGIGTPPEKEIAKTLEPGEGVLGQVAITRKPVRLSGVPCDPLQLRAALLESTPREVYITPLIHEEQLLGVLA
ncbi:MAG: GAF domain-containing protein, partial [Magnetococcus sp. YQC-9]